jgi:hypothetical protein
LLCLQSKNIFGDFMRQVDRNFERLAKEILAIVAPGQEDAEIKRVEHNGFDTIQIGNQNLRYGETCAFLNALRFVDKVLQHDVEGYTIVDPKNAFEYDVKGGGNPHFGINETYCDELGGRVNGNNAEVAAAIEKLQNLYNFVADWDAHKAADSDNVFPEVYINADCKPCVMFTISDPKQSQFQELKNNFTSDKIAGHDFLRPGKSVGGDVSKLATFCVSAEGIEEFQQKQKQAGQFQTPVGNREGGSVKLRTANGTYTPDNQPQQILHDPERDAELAALAEQRRVTKLTKFFDELVASLTNDKLKDLVKELKASEGNSQRIESYIADKGDLTADNNALLRAVSKLGDLNAVKLLKTKAAEAGTQINPLEDDCVALRFAAEGGHKDVFKELLKSCDKTVVNGHTAIIIKALTDNFQDEKLVAFIDDIQNDADLSDLLSTARILAQQLKDLVKAHKDKQSVIGSQKDAPVVNLDMDYQPTTEGGEKFVYVPSAVYREFVTPEPEKRQKLTRKPNVKDTNVLVSREAVNDALQFQKAQETLYSPDAHIAIAIENAKNKDNGNGGSDSELDDLLGPALGDINAKKPILGKTVTQLGLNADFSKEMEDEVKADIEADGFDTALGKAIIAANVEKVRCFGKLGNIQPGQCIDFDDENQYFPIEQMPLYDFAFSNVTKNLFKEDAVGICHDAIEVCRIIANAQGSGKKVEPELALLDDIIDYDVGGVTVRAVQDGDFERVACLLRNEYIEADAVLVHNFDKTPEYEKKSSGRFSCYDVYEPRDLPSLKMLATPLQTLAENCANEKLGKDVNPDSNRILAAILTNQILDKFYYATEESAAVELSRVKKLKILFNIMQSQPPKIIGLVFDQLQDAIKNVALIDFLKEKFVEKQIEKVIEDNQGNRTPEFLASLAAAAIFQGDLLKVLALLGDKYKVPADATTREENEQDRISLADFAKICLEGDEHNQDRIDIEQFIFDEQFFHKLKKDLEAAKSNPDKFAILEEKLAYCDKMENPAAERRLILANRLRCEPKFIEAFADYISKKELGEEEGTQVVQQPKTPKKKSILLPRRMPSSQTNSPAGKNSPAGSLSLTPSITKRIVAKIIANSDAEKKVSDAMLAAIKDKNKDKVSKLLNNKLFHINEAYYGMNDGSNDKNLYTAYDMAKHFANGQPDEISQILLDKMVEKALEAAKDKKLNALEKVLNQPGSHYKIQPAEIIALIENGTIPIDESGKKDLKKQDVIAIARKVIGEESPDLEAKIKKIEYAIDAKTAEKQKQETTEGSSDPSKKSKNNRMTRILSKKIVENVLNKSGASVPNDPKSDPSSREKSSREKSAEPQQPEETPNLLSGSGNLPDDVTSIPLSDKPKLIINLGADYADYAEDFNNPFMLENKDSVSFKLNKAFGGGADITKKFTELNNKNCPKDLAKDLAAAMSEAMYKSNFKKLAKSKKVSENLEALAKEGISLPSVPVFIAAAEKYLKTFNKEVTEENGQALSDELRKVQDAISRYAEFCEGHLTSENNGGSFYKGKDGFLDHLTPLLPLIEKHPKNKWTHPESLKKGNASGAPKTVDSEKPKSKEKGKDKEKEKEIPGLGKFVDVGGKVKGKLGNVLNGVWKEVQGNVDKEVNKKENDLKKAISGTLSRAQNLQTEPKPNVAAIFKPAFAEEQQALISKLKEPKKQIASEPKADEQAQPSNLLSRSGEGKKLNVIPTEPKERKKRSADKKADKRSHKGEDKGKTPREPKPTKTRNKNQKNNPQVQGTQENKETKQAPASPDTLNTFPKGDLDAALDNFLAKFGTIDEINDLAKAVLTPPGKRATYNPPVFTSLEEGAKFLDLVRHDIKNNKLSSPERPRSNGGDEVKGDYIQEFINSLTDEDREKLNVDIEKFLAELRQTDASAPSTPTLKRSVSSPEFTTPASKRARARASSMDGLPIPKFDLNARTGLEEGAPTKSADEAAAEEAGQEQARPAKETAEKTEEEQRIKAEQQAAAAAKLATQKEASAKRFREKAAQKKLEVEKQRIESEQQAAAARLATQKAEERATNLRDKQAESQKRAREKAQKAAADRKAAAQKDADMSEALNKALKDRSEAPAQTAQTAQEADKKPSHDFEDGNEKQDPASKQKYQDELVSDEYKFVNNPQDEKDKLGDAEAKRREGFVNLKARLDKIKESDLDKALADMKLPGSAEKLLEAEKKKFEGLPKRIVEVQAKIFQKTDEEQDLQGVDKTNASKELALLKQELIGLLEDQIIATKRPIEYERDRALELEGEGDDIAGIKKHFNEKLEAANRNTAHIYGELDDLKNQKIAADKAALASLRTKEAELNALSDPQELKNIRAEIYQIQAQQLDIEQLPKDELAALLPKKKISMELNDNTPEEIEETAAKAARAKETRGKVVPMRKGILKKIRELEAAREEPIYIENLKKDVDKILEAAEAAKEKDAEIDAIRSPEDILARLTQDKAFELKLLNEELNSLNEDTHTLTDLSKNKVSKEAELNSLKNGEDPAPLQQELTAINKQLAELVDLVEEKVRLFEQAEAAKEAELIAVAKTNPNPLILQKLQADAKTIEIEVGQAASPENVGKKVAVDPTNPTMKVVVASGDAPLEPNHVTAPEGTFSVEFSPAPVLELDVQAIHASSRVVNNSTLESAQKPVTLSDQQQRQDSPEALTAPVVIEPALTGGNIPPVKPVVAPIDHGDQIDLGFFDEEYAMGPVVTSAVAGNSVPFILDSRPDSTKPQEPAAAATAAPQNSVPLVDSAPFTPAASAASAPSGTPSNPASLGLSGSHNTSASVGDILSGISKLPFDKQQKLFNVFAPFIYIKGDSANRQFGVHQELIDALAGLDFPPVEKHGLVGFGSELDNKKKIEKNLFELIGKLLDVGAIKLPGNTGADPEITKGQIEKLRELLSSLGSRPKTTGLGLGDAPAEYISTSTMKFAPFTPVKSSIDMPLQTSFAARSLSTPFEAQNFRFPDARPEPEPKGEGRNDEQEVQPEPKTIKEYLEDNAQKWEKTLATNLGQEKNESGEPISDKAKASAEAMRRLFDIADKNPIEFVENEKGFPAKIKDSDPQRQYMNLASVISGGDGLIIECPDENAAQNLFAYIASGDALKTIDDAVKDNPAIEGRFSSTHYVYADGIEHKGRAGGSGKKVLANVASHLPGSSAVATKEFGMNLAFGGEGNKDAKDRDIKFDEGVNGHALFTISGRFIRIGGESSNPNSKGMGEFAEYEHNLKAKSNPLSYTGCPKYRKLSQQVSEDNKDNNYYLPNGKGQLRIVLDADDVKDATARNAEDFTLDHLFADVNPKSRRKLRPAPKMVAEVGKMEVVNATKFVNPEGQKSNATDQKTQVEVEKGIENERGKGYTPGENEPADNEEQEIKGKPFIPTHVALELHNPNRVAKNDVEKDIEAQAESLRRLKNKGLVSGVGGEPTGYVPKKMPVKTILSPEEIPGNNPNTAASNTPIILPSEDNEPTLNPLQLSEPVPVVPNHELVKAAVAYRDAAKALKARAESFLKKLQQQKAELEQLQEKSDRDDAAITKAFGVINDLVSKKKQLESELDALAQQEKAYAKKKAEDARLNAAAKVAENYVAKPYTSSTVDSPSALRLVKNSYQEDLSTGKANWGEKPKKEESGKLKLPGQDPNSSSKPIVLNVVGNGNGTVNIELVEDDQPNSQKRNARKGDDVGGAPIEGEALVISVDGIQPNPQANPPKMEQDGHSLNSELEAKVEELQRRLDELELQKKNSSGKGLKKLSAREKGLRKKLEKLSDELDGLETQTDDETEGRDKRKGKNKDKVADDNDVSRWNDYLNGRNRRIEQQQRRQNPNANGGDNYETNIKTSSGGGMGWLFLALFIAFCFLINPGLGFAALVVIGIPAVAYVAAGGGFGGSTQKSTITTNKNGTEIRRENGDHIRKPITGTGANVNVDANSNARKPIRVTKEPERRVSEELVNKPVTPGSIPTFNIIPATPRDPVLSPIPKPATRVTPVPLTPDDHRRDYAGGNLGGNNVSHADSVNARRNVSSEAPVPPGSSAGSPSNPAVTPSAPVVTPAQNLVSGAVEPVSGNPPNNIGISSPSQSARVDNNPLGGEPSAPAPVDNNPSASGSLHHRMGFRARIRAHIPNFLRVN